MIVYLFIFFNLSSLLSAFFHSEQCFPIPFMLLACEGKPNEIEDLISQGQGSCWISSARMS